MNKAIPDYVTTRGGWGQRKKVDEQALWTVSGVAWNNIKLRCSKQDYNAKLNPTYADCTNEFEGFQQFANWHMQQVGYGQGYHVDADILRVGHKKYSESTCLLVPPALNIFLQGHGGKSKVGTYPQGVYLTNNKQALRVQIYTNDSGYKFLGTFALDDLQTAQQVYKAAKDMACKEWLEKLKRGDFLVDYRVIEYLENWEFV